MVKVTKPSSSKAGRTARDGERNSGPYIESGPAQRLRCKLTDAAHRVSAVVNEACRIITEGHQIKTVFRDSDKHTKARDNNSGYLMSQLLGQCLGLVSGQDWQKFRAVVSEPFARSSAVHYLPAIERRTKVYLEETAKSDLDSGMFHPAHGMKMLAFHVIAEILYGPLTADMERQLNALAPLRERLMQMVISGGWSRFPWSRFFPSEANRKLARFRAEWHAFNLQCYQNAKAEGANVPIVRYYEAAKAGEVSFEELYHTLDEILFANLDVTLGGISWNLVLLAANRDIQSQVRAEVSDAQREKERSYEQYLLSSTTLLASCILESSRLRPLAAFSVPQAPPSDRAVSSYHFPAGTNFIVDAYSLNQRNPFWGTDAMDFRPSRFQQVKDTEARYNFWRFGFGPRQCLGKYVADLIMKVLLTQLLAGYELSMPEKQGEWERDTQTWINHLDFEILCRPYT